MHIGNGAAREMRMFQRNIQQVLLLAFVAGLAALGAHLLWPASAEEAGRMKASKNGLYNVALRPEDGEPTVGPIHTWLVTLTAADGERVEDASITVDGGMPAHGHGLPTQPEMVDEIEPGIYRIDGMKFSMKGQWELRLAIEAAPGADTIAFHYVLD